jgi:hypothetical protein
MQINKVVEPISLNISVLDFLYQYEKILTLAVK